MFRNRYVQIFPSARSRYSSATLSAQQRERGQRESRHRACARKVQRDCVLLAGASKLQLAHCTDCACSAGNVSHCPAAFPLKRKQLSVDNLFVLRSSVFTSDKEQADGVPLGEARKSLMTSCTKTSNKAFPNSAIHYRPAAQQQQQQQRLLLLQQQRQLLLLSPVWPLAKVWMVR